jgi:hypothetical protein
MGRVVKPMITSKNNRRHRRIPYVGPLRISWEEQGQQCFAQARCIDISEDGMRIEVARPVRPGTCILLSAERLKLSGAASVKHMDRSGGKYLLGLNLTQAMAPGKLAELERRPVVTLDIENFNRIHQKV